MRIALILLILIFNQSCSFDKKSGIWNSQESVSKKDSDLFDGFRKLSNTKDIFDKEIQINQNIKFDISNIVKPRKWSDEFYNFNNNYDNFSFKGENKLLFKSKRVSRNKLSKKIYYSNDFFITSDKKGNILIFSISKNELVTKFNFYKKRYKKLEKNLNLVLKKDVIYVTDNIGYVYALDILNKKILWAKKYNIPFRSNLKIYKKNLITVDQNNKIYFFNIQNGELIKNLPTEDTKVKNSFVNNLSINKDLIFLLNTYGSLYAVSGESLNIEWFINLNQSLNINPNTQFNGNPVVSNDNFVVATTTEATYLINSSNATIYKKFNIVTQIKPLIIKNHVFIVSNNNFLICINLNNGTIVYSYKIDKKISNFLKIEEQNAYYKDIIFANNRILILLRNSYFLELDLNGNLIKIFKLKEKINSNLIFINKSLIYLDNKGKVITII